MENKSVIFTFGRFQPPHIGHAKMLDSMISLANEIYQKTGEIPKIIIFTSITGPEKGVNRYPLSINKKMNYLVDFFSHYIEKYDVEIISEKSPYSAAELLIKQNYNNIIMVCGEDRLKSYQSMENRYGINEKTQNEVNKLIRNNKLFCQNFRVIALDRDPDQNASATKLRNSVGVNKKIFINLLNMGNKNGLKNNNKKKLWDNLSNILGRNKSVWGNNIVAGYESSDNVINDNVINDNKKNPDNFKLRRSKRLLKEGARKKSYKKKYKSL